MHRVLNGTKYFSIFLKYYLHYYTYNTTLTVLLHATFGKQWIHIEMHKQYT